MGYFQNKVIWITGASSGIGEALVFALVKQGAKVIVSARRKEELERVKKASQHPEKVFVLPLDLTESNTFETKTQEAVNAFGQIDILVHNGGISQRSYVRDTQMEVYRRIMEVNYFGYIGLTRAILPHFVNRNTGQFVVISSVLGKLGTPMRAAYAGSKHALHGFFDCLRAEFWENNIQVTMICPGYVRTNVAINALTATGDTYKQMGVNTGNGYPADKCALQILKAIRKRKNEAYVGKPFGLERLGLLVKRLFPNLFVRLARKQVPK